jgi:hypothetical protein
VACHSYSTGYFLCTKGIFRTNTFKFAFLHLHNSVFIVSAKASSNSWQRARVSGSVEAGLISTAFAVLSAARMKMAIFWDAVPCTLVRVYRLLRGTCCLYRQGCEQQVRLKRCWTSTRLHGVSMQKAAVLCSPVFTPWHMKWAREMVVTDTMLTRLRTTVCLKTVSQLYRLCTARQ